MDTCTASAVTKCGREVEWVRELETTGTKLEKLMELLLQLEVQLQAMVETIIIIIILHPNQVIHLNLVIHPNLVIPPNRVTHPVRECILSHIPKLECPLECLKLILPLECPKLILPPECPKLILLLECLAIHLNRIPLPHQHLELVLALVRVESL